MKYTEIIEALKEELGFERILGVREAWGGICQACGESEHILHIKGRSNGGERGPMPFEDIYLCANRKACGKREGEKRQEVVAFLEQVFVALDAPNLPPTLLVQVNGIRRGIIATPAVRTEAGIAKLALAEVEEYTASGKVKRVVVVGGAANPRLVSVILEGAWA